MGLVKSNIVMSVVLGSLLLGMAGAANALTINSTVHGFVRDFGPQNGTGDGLNPSFVEVLNNNPGSQDRGIIEFDISTLTGPIGTATLNLTESINSLLASHSFDVFGFTGDGLLTNSDYAAGATALGSFNYFNQGTVNFDITGFINSQIALNDPLHFAGLRIVW